MTTPTADAHWLDRLALRATRGGFLKGALTAAALTLPFAGGASARGAVSRSAGCAAPTRNPNACRTGCFYASHKQYEARWDTCEKQFYSQLPAYLTGFFTFGWLGAAAVGAPAIANFHNCADLALVRAKAMQYDCLQPNCPGFDPCGPGGPCEVCIGGAKCCPAPDDNLLGYVCCACCNPETGEGCGAPCPGP